MQWHAMERNAFRGSRYTIVCSCPAGSGFAAPKRGRKVSFNNSLFSVAVFPALLCAFYFCPSFRVSNSRICYFLSSCLCLPSILLPTSVRCEQTKLLLLLLLLYVFCFLLEIESRKKGRERDRKEEPLPVRRRERPCHALI